MVFKLLDVGLAMHTSFISGHLLKLLWVSLVSKLDILCHCVCRSHLLFAVPSTLQPSRVPYCLGRALLLMVSLSLFAAFLSSCFSCNCCSLVLGVVGVGSSISPLYAGPSIFKHQRDSGWMGGHSQGCHGYLLFMLEHCSAPPTL